MSLSEIEAALPRLSADELRQLAFKSWSALARKEGQVGAASECDEDDPALLAALDEAVTRAEAAPGLGLSGEEVRSRLAGWISK